jgi:hypothetical protein
MRLPFVVLVPLATLVFAVGCGSVEAGSGRGAGGVTWHQDIAPIVHRRCTSCHRPGSIAPFSLETYAEAKATSGLLVTMVETGQMPPWSAVSTDDCSTRFGWQDDPRLTPDELDLLRAWHEDGAPEGDPAKAAPLPGPFEGHLDGVTQTLAPPQPYTTSGTQDQQICFVLDPSIAAATWLTGLEVRPDNLEVVHHVVVEVVPPDAAGPLLAQVQLGAAFDCFSVEGGFGEIYHAGVWVPGARPFETPEGTGIPIAPGSLFLVNIHYHPTGYDHAPDLTTVDLRMTTAQPPKNYIIISELGNADQPPELLPGPNDPGAVEFRVPAGVPDHTESMAFPLTGDGEPLRYPVTGIFPHMHYVGVDLDARIKRTTPAPGEPAEECLVKVPNWDFDWQRTYFYDAPIDQLPTVGGGDTIELRCLYNNTTENPFVQRMMAEENLSGPIDVQLGEQTTDEMCLIYIGVIY